MSSRLLLFGLLIPFFFILGCISDSTDNPETDSNPENSLPSSAAQALEDSTSFELLSLDPDSRAQDNDGNRFHGWNVLGKTAITDSDTRAELISRFKAGVAENDGTVAMCFNPRHGIKLANDGTTHEFVICFECFQVQWFIDGNRNKGFLITDSPQLTFDKVLKDSNVPLAEKPKG